MTASEPRPVAVARTLWALAERDAPAVDDVQEIIDRLFTLLEAGLRRWIGAEGYAALLSRAIADTVAAHPILSSIPDLGADECWAATSHASARAMSREADAGARRDAIIALLAAMMQQLGGIIGEPMAIRLIELSGTPTPRGIAGPEANDT